MSYKTDRLVDLFPEAYAADDSASLLYKLLDAIGAEFTEADESIKQLLKSHWVDYAEGAALDNLAAIYGVHRRLMRSGRLEDDPTFRLRLKSTISLFTGGGTVKAIIRAVRSALGLPLDIEKIDLPLRFTTNRVPQNADQLIKNMRAELVKLVELVEFNPQGVTLRSLPRDVEEVENAYQIKLDVDIVSADVKAVRPEIWWKFEQPGSYMLVLTCQATDGTLAGFKTIRPVRLDAGQILVFTAQDDGKLKAEIQGGANQTGNFVDLDGVSQASMPIVPPNRSTWLFRNLSGRIDQQAQFDVDSFDPSSQFTIEMRWLKFNPLTFTVTIPYFVREALEAIFKRYSYRADEAIWLMPDGLPIDVLPEVINQTRAAGVQAVVQFVLNFYEDHAMRERFLRQGTFIFDENQDMTDTMAIGNTNSISESQEMDDHFAIGGIFDVATFDSQFVFTGE